jgi:hypothetical protein
MIANAGPRSQAKALFCGRWSAGYGIWYASDDIVKTANLM